MSVVQFRAREHSAEATRKAIEDEFMRLAEKYGVYEVLTVATYLVAQAIETSNDEGSRRQSKPQKAS